MPLMLLYRTPPRAPANTHRRWSVVRLTRAGLIKQEAYPDSCLNVHPAGAWRVEGSCIKQNLMRGERL